MHETLRLFVVAGEASGDRLGADLIQRLRHKVPLTLSGVGGSRLAEEGLETLFPMADLAVMGIGDVVAALPRVLRRMREVRNAILGASPDVVVLIDSQVFSAMLARRLRRAGYRKPILLYVAPSVWAHRPHRAAKLKPLFDEVLAVLPFEPAAMERLGGPPTVYVGHPALTEGHSAPAGDEGRRIALLPGSRSGELKRHLPLFARVAAELASRLPEASFFIPTLPHLEARIEREAASWPLDVEVVTSRDKRAQYYAESRLAFVASGTATLELALAGVPMVMTYVLGALESRYYLAHGAPPVGLPNIILKANVVPEFVSARPDIARILDACVPLYQGGEARDRQLEALGRLHHLMEEGAENAKREDPAERVLAHFVK